jgi:hypothetical protein
LIREAFIAKPMVDILKNPATVDTTVVPKPKRARRLLRIAAAR